MSQLVLKPQYDVQRSSDGNVLVFACAWCPKSSLRKLQSGEVYTHGVCGIHKKYLLHTMLAGRARQ